MLDHDFEELLEQAVIAVLENMFFTAPAGPVGPHPAAPVVEARLGFHGPLSGTLTVRVSQDAARTLAAAFLGEDEGALSAALPGQVVCELANILCGRLISNLEEERFVLEPPELIPAGRQQNLGVPLTAQRSFAIENGILTVSLHAIVPA